MRKRLNMMTSSKYRVWVILLCAVIGSGTSTVARADRGVRPGVETLIEQDFAAIAGKRVGLITNPTGVTSDFRSTIDVLHEASNVQLVRLFGPEHGVRGEVPAGEHVTQSTDAVTGLPVLSLYGRTRKPTPEMLAGLDVVVFDVQDIGSRSYTFISTLALAMEAAAEQGVAFVVLDRPNPLGGLRIEGRPLDLKYRSFVGQLPVPYCHGMTVGELAQMINGEHWLADGRQCRLTVVPMQGWRRAMLFHDAQLPWVPSSPHIPRSETAFFYAATGIMGELGVISEGVGYPLPFELVGHPDLPAHEFAAKLNRRKLPGVHFQPYYFRPYYGPFKGQTCGGARVILTDPQRAALTEIQFHVMDVARSLLPRLTLFGSDRQAMFDKVCGTDGIRKLLEARRPLEEILTFWRAGVNEFRERRKPYLLYQ